MNFQRIEGVVSMKRFFFTVLSFVVLATVIGISWWELQAQTLESAACIANSACGGDCLVFTKVDESCSSGGRCVAIIAIEATRVLNIANQPHQEIPVKRVEQLM